MGRGKCLGKCGTTGKGWRPSWAGGGGSGGVACAWVYFIPRLVVKSSNVCCKAQLILRDAPVRWRYWVDNACRSAVEAGVGAGEIV